MDQHQSVGGPYNVRGFPTIKIFGLDKNKPQDYNGEFSLWLLHSSKYTNVMRIFED